LSERALRSPRLGASFKSPTSLAWLMRDGRCRAIRRSLRGAAAQPHFVAFTVGIVRLKGDLAVETPREALQAFLPVALEVSSEVGMHADHHLAAVRVVGGGGLGLHTAEDLGGQRRVRLRDAAALARRARDREQRAEVLAHA